MSKIDEFLEYKSGIDKEAGKWDAIKGLIPFMRSGTQRAASKPGAVVAKGTGHQFKETMEKGLQYAGAAALLGGGAQAAEAGWEAGTSALNKVIGFRKMMKTNPDLEQKDKAKVHSAYGTLHRFNPEMAKDPFVAGSWVKSVAEYDTVPTRTVADLIGARARTEKKSILERGLPLMLGGQQAMRIEQGADPMLAQTIAAAQARGKASVDTSERVRQMAEWQGEGKARGEAHAMGVGTPGEAAQEKARFGQLGKNIAMEPQPDPQSVAYHSEWGKQRAQFDVEQARGVGIGTPTEQGEDIEAARPDFGSGLPKRGPIS